MANDGLTPGDEFVDSTGMPRYDDSAPEVDSTQAMLNGFPQGEDVSTDDRDAADYEAFKNSFGLSAGEQLSPEDQAVADAFAEKKADARAEESGQEAENEGVLSAEEQEERSRALSALQRGGMTLEDFSSVDVAIERGLKLAEAQAKTDAKFAEKRQAGRTDSTPGNDAVAPGQTETHTQTDSELLDAFTELFGDEGKGVGEKLTSRLQALSEAVDGRLGAVMEWMEKTELRQARAADPRLASDKAWKATMAAYERIQASPAYEGQDGLHQAVRDATNIVLGPPAAARSEKKTLDKQKASGSMTSPNAQNAKGQVDPHLRSDLDGFRNAFKRSEALQVDQYGQAGIL